MPHYSITFKSFQKICKSVLKGGYSPPWQNLEIVFTLMFSVKLSTWTLKCFLDVLPKFRIVIWVCFYNTFSTPNASLRHICHKQTLINYIQLILKDKRSFNSYNIDLFVEAIIISLIIALKSDCPHLGRGLSI